MSLFCVNCTVLGSPLLFHSEALAIVLSWQGVDKTNIPQTLKNEKKILTQWNDYYRILAEVIELYSL